MKFECIKKHQKNVAVTFFQIILVIFIISSFFQIMPFRVKIVQEASASSTWFDTNWSAPDSYNDSWQVETIKESGDLRLYYGPGIFVANTVHDQIVQTNMNGSIWTALGSEGSGKGQFNGTCGISYDDSTGFIYVMDYFNGRIVKTKIDGSGWTIFGSRGNGTGQFYNPGTLHYDSSTGYIYVADAGNHRIVKTMMNGSGWTTYGSYGYGTGLFKEPWGLCYDNSTGYIYVADYFNYRIVKTKMDGTGWTTYGSGGTGTGQFNNPHSVYYNNSTDDIYVADRYNHRIVKTKMNGSGWTVYGSQGGGIGQFRYPEGIEYDSDTGYVYVADSGNHRIVKTMMNGSGWTTYGSCSDTPGKGKFYYPSDITLYDSCYCCKGYLTSKIYDCGGPSNFQTISWVGETPINTSIKFQLKTANNESNLTTKDFIGPDGTCNTYYTTSGAAIWSGHNGSRWVQYRVNLSSSDFSKTPVLKDVTIIYNILPKRPILISPENNTCTNNNTTTFIWLFNDTDSGFQSAFQWQVDDLINFSSVDYDSSPVMTSISSFTPASSISDGSWYWRVRARDSDNDWGLYSKPWKIVIDTIAPTSNIIYPSNNKFYNNIASISGLTSDSVNGSEIRKVELSIHGITDDSYWDGTSWVDTESWLLVSGTSKWNYNSSVIPWSSGMEYRIRSRAVDNASNIEIPGVGNTFIYDAKYVIYSNAYPLADEISNTTKVEVGITISDKISRVNASTIDYSTSTNEGQNWTSWESVEKCENGKDINVKLNLTFLNGTGNRIRWRASDLAGNGPTYSKQYIININEQPDLPQVQLLTPKNNLKLLTASVELSWEVIKNYHPYVVFAIKLDTTNPPQYIIEQNYTDTNLIIDDLENGQTYYWTVIPKLGSLNGICVSGIWSFKIDIPLPKVNLVYPLNGSVIQTTNLTLKWSTKYLGSKAVTYSIYFGTEKDPLIYQTNITKKYFTLEFTLEENVSYYWYVVPWAEGLKGYSSPLWSFSVKKEFGPIFGLKLELEPMLVSLKPGGSTYAKAKVTNQGDVKDSVSLNIEISPGIGVGAIANESIITDIHPGYIGFFNITITAVNDIDEDQAILFVTVASEKAKELGKTVEAKETLTVKILRTEKPGKDKSSTEQNLWIFLLIAIIIIIVVIILLIVLKRKKRAKEELPTSETVTIKPIPVSDLERSQEQLSPTPTVAQHPTVSIPESEKKAITPGSSAPELPSLSMESHEATPQPIPQVQDKPQLPPAGAQIGEKKSDDNESRGSGSV